MAVRFAPRVWRYLLPLLLLPGALYALEWRQAGAQDARPGQLLLQSASAEGSADDAELLLQFVGTQELQRQAQHEIDALFE